MMTRESKLRVVFMGTPLFAVASLDAIRHSSHNVVTVVTVPDKPAGRGRKLKESDVKVYAQEHHIPLLQPEKLTDSIFQQQLREAKPDVIVVVAFRMLPEGVWKIPPLGTINLHASLLPQYRGAAPINRAIMNGETHTGLTTFIIDQQIDTGHILLQHPIEIGSDETAGALHDRMKMEGAQLLVKTLDLIASGGLKSVPQEQIPTCESLKPAPKIFKEETRINWFAPAPAIYNHIRGLSPYPGAFFTIHHPDKEELIIRVFNCGLSTTKNPDINTPMVRTDGHSFAEIRLPDGAILLYEVQLQGRKRMKISEFLRGFTLDSSWKP